MNAGLESTGANEEWIRSIRAALDENLEAEGIRPVSSSSAAASFLPARRASRLTVREALAYE